MTFEVNALKVFGALGAAPMDGGILKQCPNNRRGCAHVELVLADVLRFFAHVLGKVPGTRISVCDVFPVVSLFCSPGKHQGKLTKKPNPIKRKGQQQSIN